MTIQEKRLSMVSFRASAEEISRIDRLVARIRRKYTFMNKSDVLRELVGLTKSGLVTQEMRASLTSDTPDEPAKRDKANNSAATRNERSGMK